MNGKKTQRLLVVTYHFPPDGAVGGLRWAGYSKYLGRLGWDVHIVTAAHAGAEAEAEHVHRHAPLRRQTMNDAYNAAARRVRGARRARTVSAPPHATASPAPAASSAERRTSMVARTLSEIRLAGIIAMSFPDVGRGWLLRAAGIARGLLRQQAFDAVVTSGPPHSVHFVGMMATLGRREPHFVDMRDPWHQSQETWATPGITSGSVQSMWRVARNALFKRARSLIVNTPALAESLLAAEPHPAVAYVPNGIDLELLPRRTTERLEGFSIAYVGTLYMGRNLSTVLDALRALVQDRPRLAAAVKIHVAGHTDASNMERLRAQLAADGLTDMVRFYGPVPRVEALSLLARSNLALVLAQNQPTQIPAKIYECVGLGVPTLVLTEPDSAAAREARRIGALTFESDNVAAMRALLDDIVDGRLPDTIPPKVPISYEALAHQMDEVLRRRERNAASSGTAVT